MKIVHVITRLLTAGSEENTVATCLHQVSQGHEVWIIHGDEFDPQWYAKLSPQLTLVRMDEMVHAINPSQDLAAVAALRRFYRRVKPDVIHTHQSKAGILGRIAAIGSGVPVVAHTVHIAPFLNVGLGSKAFYVAAEAICALFTDLIINVSEGMRAACLKHGVGRQSQHVVIHSGMPVERFQNAQAPADWRERIGGWPAGDRPIFLLMLAAFEPRKRQEGFIRAMGPHLERNPGLCLLFGGAGARLEASAALVEQMNLQNQVRFLGHDPKPEDLVALADICLLTSEREGLPRVVVQYLAGGKPVVLTDLPGIGELVVDGVNGLIAVPNDLAAAADLAAGVAADPSRLAQLSAGARATDVSPWAQVRMGEAIELAYGKVLSRKGPQAKR